MSNYVMVAAVDSLPKAMILTITLSVFAVLLLAGFVFYMWRSQEKDAFVAREVKAITESIGAGVVHFIASGNGRLTYCSSGFYKLVGFAKEEISEKFGNCFYFMLEDKFCERMKSIEIGEGFVFSEELSMKTASGPKWVLFQGNGIVRKSRNGAVMTVSAVIIDIDETKKLADKLAYEQHKYRMATEISNDIIFNYDIDEDKLELSEIFNKVYGGSAEVFGFKKNRIWENGCIHADCAAQIEEMIEHSVRRGDSIDEELRIRDIEGKYVWCRLIGRPIADATGRNHEYIGKIVNIEKHRNKVDELQVKASQDPLTGALNKEFTQNNINKYIKDHPDSPGMLLLVDIDHFKQVNDNYGHLMGDNIIKEVVSQTKRAFRSGDIVGRIGGDEFVVFVCNVKNPEDQIKQAKKLHEVLRQPVTIDGVTVNKSASIGVALYPDHADSYAKLVECADKALYEVKGSGRDSFIIYGNH